MVVLYKIWKKCNEIKLTKYKMDLNNRKIKNHPPSHRLTTTAQWYIVTYFSYCNRNINFLNFKFDKCTFS